MNRKKYVFFDLDGTITNPKEGITKAVEFALSKFDIKVENRNTLVSFIGPPLRDSFREYFNFTHAQANEAIKFYRQYYLEDGGLFDCYVYPNVQRTLKLLRDNGKKLVMATAKPQDFAIDLMKHFSLDTLFEDICGASMDETRTKKDEVIAYALKRNAISDISDVVMVGDRKYDILGAKKFDMDSIGVLYGYGTREEFEKAGADCICDDITDLVALI